MGKRKKLYSLYLKEKKKKEIFSLYRKLRITSRKVRNYTNLIKGKNLEEAINILENFLNYKIANILKKLILSAFANYKYKILDKKKKKNLYIKNIIVNNFKIKKKIKYCAQGRIGIIRKKYCNIKLEIK
ncbi:MAG: hypothetical protein NHG09_00560 [Candidatus Shikimatogenerans sp. JK-2022]|nr:hypothetical protein [Candidatus Shikimatogenerans bostrichidophilus]